MYCNTEALNSILPIWLRSELNKHITETLQELRLRIHMPVELRYGDRRCFLSRSATRDDILFCINAASKYSPWSANTIRFGYITAPGGHRIGICGNVVYHNGTVTGIRNLTSICIRVSRDFPGLAITTADLSGSTLIIGPPGSGKTTFLRDFIRQKSNKSISISVVDERSEIFPEVNGQFCFPIGKHTDVMSGCSKSYGIETVLRTMTPEVIAVDEITVAEDCAALQFAGWCGVSLLATAHASSKKDLLSRPLYKPLLSLGLFQNLIIINRDKSWSAERMW